MSSLKGFLLLSVSPAWGDTGQIPLPLGHAHQFIPQAPVGLDVKPGAGDSQPGSTLLAQGRFGAVVESGAVSVCWLRASLLELSLSWLLHCVMCYWKDTTVSPGWPFHSERDCKMNRNLFSLLSQSET